MKSTYDKIVAEVLATCPQTRDEMEPWRRISILIQCGFNYAMSAEMERGETVKQAQVAEGVAHGLASIIFNLHANASDFLDKESADKTVTYVANNIALAAAKAMSGNGPEVPTVGKPVYAKPPN